MAELISNQQMALAGLLAASALAHLPIQPELSPIRTPDINASRNKRLEVDGKGAIRKSPGSPLRRIPMKTKPILGYPEPATGLPPAVIEQAKLHQHRLRFLLERQRQSLKRTVSIGKKKGQKNEFDMDRRNGSGLLRIKVEEDWFCWTDNMDGPWNSLPLPKFSATWYRHNSEITLETTHSQRLHIIDDFLTMN